MFNSNGINKYYKKPNSNTGQVLLPNEFNSGQVLTAKCFIKKHLLFRTSAFFQLPFNCNLTNTR